MIARLMGKLKIYRFSVFDLKTAYEKLFTRHVATRVDENDHCPLHSPVKSLETFPSCISACGISASYLPKQSAVVMMDGLSWRGFQKEARGIARPLSQQEAEEKARFLCNARSSCSMHLSSPTTELRAANGNSGRSARIVPRAPSAALAPGAHSQRLYWCGCCAFHSAIFGIWSIAL